MGNPISKAIDSQAQDNKQKATDLLTSMYTMGEDKKKMFEQGVIGKLNPSEIPINKVLVRDSLIKCSVHNDAKEIAKEIGGIIRTFCDGDIVEGITASLGFVIGTVLSSVAGNVSEKTSYMVTIKGLAIYRLDFYSYVYEYKDESLKKIAENVLVSSYMISSIKFAEVDKETLMAVIGLNVDDYETQCKMYEKLNAIYKEDNLAYSYVANGVEFTPDVGFQSYFHKTVGTPSPLYNADGTTKDPHHDGESSWIRLLRANNCSTDRCQVSGCTENHNLVGGHMALASGTTLHKDDGFILTCICRHHNGQKSNVPFTMRSGPTFVVKVTFFNQFF